jgi:hypothetical protein
VAHRCCPSITNAEFRLPVFLSAGPRTIFNLLGIQKPHRN